MGDITTIIGFMASISAASLFFPQVWTSYKTKRTKDIAWTGIFIGLANGMLWVIYGVLKADPFIYVTNSAMFLGVFLLAMLKRQYDGAE